MEPARLAIAAASPLSFRTCGAAFGAVASSTSSLWSFR